MSESRSRPADVLHLEARLKAFNEVYRALVNEVLRLAAALEAERIALDWLDTRAEAEVRVFGVGPERTARRTRVTYRDGGLHRTAWGDDVRGAIVIAAAIGAEAESGHLRKIDDTA